MKKSIYLMIVVYACMLTACHTHKDDKTSDDSHLHAGEVEFTDEQAKNAQLKLETVTPAQFSSVIKTSGQIQSLQGDEQTIVATSSGVVNYRNGSITEGTSVSAGETIVTISAKDLQDGDPVYKAKIMYETAEKEFKRAERLVADKIISTKEYEQVRMNYETARASYIGQAGHLTSGGVAVTSPMAGYVKSRIAANGQFVNVGEPIAVVARNKRLQLRADVSEIYYRQLHGIRSANFKTTYDDTVTCLDNLNGRLLSYGKTSAEGTSYIPVTFEFDNIGDIVPGAYVEVFLLSTPRENVISVPLSAVIEEQGLFFVYVLAHKEVYRKQEVTLGENDGRRVEITRGLKKGDRVVVNGAYQVKMASSAGTIPGHTHNH